MHLRTSARRRPTVSGAAAAAVAAGLLLGGCAESGAPEEPGGSPPPSGTSATASPSPPASPSVPADPSPTASASPGPSATPTPTAHGRWGAYATREEACSAVANDLLALALLPASLSGDPSPEQVRAVEDRVAEVRGTAPPALSADLARVQLLVDSYGEALAQDPEAEFDGEELDQALTPVRAWLEETCRDAG